ncbi:unnamed protein product [Rotaria sordida]|uniref:Fucosyltransferase n=2 Tax=Rotaria sordida TaxID=392033 RepID=A0A813SM78_9BILA|nr:unnamed protein product [Rotaria sordida]CAF0880625.1 unnamed protein product [Rotaria sordida]CAF3693277.1 unnamed protein product [Rotaria sordida]
MEYQKYFKYFCLFVLCTFLFYLFVTNDYTRILVSLKIPFITSLNIINSSRENSLIINLTNNSIIELSSITNQFETRLSDYYPHLPIHIFTQNLSLTGNTSKLILLGNGFFGTRDWGIASSSRSSTEKMTAIHCPFLSNYCDITTDNDRFSEADAIVYHMRDGIDLNRAKTNRHPKQRFVFALWESPAHTPNLQSYNQFFNWTMTYRFDSHIITSYYSQYGYIHTSSSYYKLILNENSTRKLNYNIRKLDHQPSDEILQKKKLGTAAALISNCGGSSQRLGFINKLKQYIDVKVYGRCGESCPAKTNCRKFIAENYYFILSFENSLCSDYTTEKFFAALEHPIVPVVLGRTNYSYFIPSSGYIDINQFSNMNSLAQYLNETRYNKEKYLSYFLWKKDYVWGLNQFFTPFCDLCLRLHLDLKPNIIDNMHQWWFNNSCQAAHILP